MTVAQNPYSMISKSMGKKQIESQAITNNNFMRQNPQIGDFNVLNAKEHVS
jgi:hypothetical protein